MNKAYAAMPTRLYLVGTGGRIEYAGGLDPFGFKPAELNEAIETYLSQGADSIGDNSGRGELSGLEKIE